MITTRCAVRYTELLDIRKAFAFRKEPVEIRQYRDFRRLGQPQIGRADPMRPLVPVP